MDDDELLDASIRERIDACRPDSDDLQLPELAEVAQQVQHDPAAQRRMQQVNRIDRRIQTAMHAVSVPEGLLARLTTVIETTAVTRAVPSTIAAPVSRRRWIWISASIAASLLVVGGGLLAFSLRANRPTDIVTLASNWETKLSNRWRPIADAPRAFPTPRQLAVVPRGWQSMAFFQGYRGVVYDLLPANHGRAMLFVVNVKPHGELPSSPPETPQHSSNSLSVAAWFAGNRMCLLMVKGDERLYHRLIRASTPVLASL
jgi:hypothetical protein